MLGIEQLKNAQTAFAAKFFDRVGLNQAKAVHFNRLLTKVTRRELFLHARVLNPA